MLIVFHRPELKRFIQLRSSEPPKSENTHKDATLVPMRSEPQQAVAKSGTTFPDVGIGESSYTVKAHGNDFSVHFSTKRNGTVYKGDFSAKFRPGRRIYFYYYGAIGAVVSEELGGGLLPVRRLPNGEGYFYLGQVLMTKTDSLLWLRGRFADISGVRNFHANERENSVDVFCRYSREAAQIIKSENELADRISGIDVTAMIDRLQTQVNLLTKMVLNPAAAEKNGVKEVLAETVLQEQTAEAAKKRLVRHAAYADQVERAYR